MKFCLFLRIADCHFSMTKTSKRELPLTEMINQCIILATCGSIYLGQQIVMCIFCIKVSHALDGERGKKACAMLVGDAI